MPEINLYPLSEKKVLQLIFPLKYSCGVFLETAYPDKENKNSFLFLKPYRVLTYNLDQPLDNFFKDIETSLSQGFWLAGYFSYEFGYLFEESLRRIIGSLKINFPLVWLGVFKKPLIIEHSCLDKGVDFLKIDDWEGVEEGCLNMNFSEYKQALRRIKYYLREGQTYQVNFTLKYKAKFSGDVLKFYLKLRRSQPTPYLAFINDGKKFILSFSPELFFRIKGNKILVRPMKGTLKRARFLEEDEVFIKILSNDLKNRAENLMIVDLLRNDLGKIAYPGSVRVKELFTVEKYPSLFQMTSSIQAKLKSKTSIGEIFKALFPSGSVSGAPKIRTMQIIKELEKEPRGVYTGSIGFISPFKEACFNVAIRTLVIKDKNLELGIGGGIVYDSKPSWEYGEAILKASFLTKKEPSFSLIESILWERGRFWLLDLHLKRLKKSAEYFGIPLDLKEIKKRLKDTVKNFSPHKKYKVRLLIDRQGKIKISYSLLREIQQPVLVKISSQKIDPQDRFLYHKTTQRALYDTERKKALSEGFFEVIFTNKKGELTEGSISNIFLVKNSKLYTPPLSSGCLPGVLREYLLKTKQVEDKVLYLKDILKAKEVYIGNSVRGLIKARVIFKKEKM